MAGTERGGRASSLKDEGAENQENHCDAENENCIHFYMQIKRQK